MGAGRDGREPGGHAGLGSRKTGAGRSRYAWAGAEEISGASAYTGPSPPAGLGRGSGQGTRKAEGAAAGRVGPGRQAVAATCQDAVGHGAAGTQCAPLSCCTARADRSVGECGPLVAPAYSASPFTEAAAEGDRLEGKGMLRLLRGVLGGVAASAASCCCSRPVASRTTSTATFTFKGAPQMLRMRGGRGAVDHEYTCVCWFGLVLCGVSGCEGWSVGGGRRPASKQLPPPWSLPPHLASCCVLMPAFNPTATKRRAGSPHLTKREPGLLELSATPILQRSTSCSTSRDGRGAGHYMSTQAGRPMAALQQR